MGNEEKRLKIIKDEIAKYIKKYGNIPDEITLTPKEMSIIKYAKINKLDLTIEFNGKKYPFPPYKRMWQL